MSTAGPTGVLLVNVGTPDAPTTGAVRRYLREFLSDPYVVDLPAWFWKPLLNLVILPIRSRTSARLYRRVWTDAGSPLLTIGQSAAERLQVELGRGFAVVLGMRVGRPSLEEALATFAERGVERAVLVPLFPQYSRSTVGSIVARVEELVAETPGAPRFATVPPFYDDEGYLAAVAARVRETVPLEELEHLVLSFHGIPVSAVEKGDPYPEQCRATAAGLARLLDLPAERWSLSFQSRLGPARWLEPYTAEHVLELGRTHRRLHVACPGFAADCLETLDEIGDVLAEDLRRERGAELVLVPAVNDGAGWIHALAALVRRTLAEQGAGVA